MSDNWMTEWEHTRSLGVLRYVLVRGILSRGIFLSALSTLIWYLTEFGLSFHPEYFIRTGTIVFFFGGVILYGLTIGITEWRAYEKAYLQNLEINTWERPTLRLPFKDDAA